MIDVTIVLLGVSIILILGFAAEFIFHKTKLPDVLFLIIIGFLIGPNVSNFVTPQQVIDLAPLFTTFTLLFLLFDGAFNINLSSLIKELGPSLRLTIFNFVISAGIITLIMFLAGSTFMISLLTGFILGGTSSAFVIPLLKQLNVSKKIYSLLTFESALTDVFCVVSAVTVIEIIKIGTFHVQETASTLIALFAVAIITGIITGIIWIIISTRLLREHNYMLTIAILILIYLITEYLNGNGAIATLTFGIVLKNSKQLISIISKIKRSTARNKQSATTHTEEFFYHQISFLLKTFFFVYIGILIDFSNTKALIIGIIITIALLLSRKASLLLTKKEMENGRSLVNAIFARGLAAAAIAQLAIAANISQAAFIANIVYIVITGTIIASSMSIFITQRTTIWQKNTKPNPIFSLKHKKHIPP